MRPKGWRKLYGNRLLVKPDEVFISSILATPDSVRVPRPETGVVVELGHTVDEIEFSVGMKIAFTPHAGTVANLKEESLLLITPSEVMAWIAHPLPEEVPDGTPV